MIEKKNLVLKGICFCYLAAVSFMGFSQVNSPKSQKKIAILKNEFWWGGAVNKAHEMPFRDSFSINLSGDSYGNQTAPLLISSQGRYVWSGQPFAFNVDRDSLVIEFAGEGNVYVSPAKSLHSAYTEASSKFFKADGRLPDSLLFTAPQYNTWIELIYNQNQEDILKYARGIIANGFPPGVLMIDDNWFPAYGSYVFRKDRFPDAKQTVDELHKMGFKVMLWVCPFISPDTEAFRDAMAKRILLLDNKGNRFLTWQEASEPAIVKWWNGHSAVLDLSNPDAAQWFKEKLNTVQNDYGIDGFKFDAGDAEFYTGDQFLSFGNIDANEQSERWGAIGLAYPLNEYRAMWKNAGKPLVERLRDKYHNWEDLQKLVPHATMAGLLGYAFVCPDMIGGGDFSSFRGNDKLDQDLIVRSAQCHALMPMMQFSVAPWRVLDSVHLKAVKQAVQLRSTLTPYILQLAREAAKTGEPIVRSMEYSFPDQGFENVKDQFVLGNDYMVAPVLNASGERVIFFPRGKWQDMNSLKIITGPKSIKSRTGIGILPYFKRL